MLTENVSIDGRARIANDGLSEEERRLVAAKFAALTETPVERWPEHGVRRLGGEWTYLLRVTDSLLVFFTSERGQFVIQDFVRQATLDRFFALRRN